MWSRFYVDNVVSKPINIMTNEHIDQCTSIAEFGHEKECTLPRRFLNTTLSEEHVDTTLFLLKLTDIKLYRRFTWRWCSLSANARNVCFNISKHFSYTNTNTRTSLQHHDHAPKRTSRLQEITKASWNHVIQYRDVKCL